MSIVKTLTSAGPYSAGQAVTYSIVVSNAGPSPATNINVTDTPANLTITSVSGACAALPCVIPSLGVAAEANLTVTATINAAGTFDNAATATAAEPDPDPTDNTDDGNDGFAPSVDLAIVKTVSSPTVAVGQQFSFTLVVTNNGPDTATNVIVTDPLPPTFALTSASMTRGSCTGTTTVTCTLGTMLNGGTVTTITLTGSATAPGTMNNTASVDSDESEAVTSNNSSSAGPAVTAPIPTASEWGLLFLALTLALTGVYLSQR